MPALSVEGRSAAAIHHLPERCRPGGCPCGSRQQREAFHIALDAAQPSFEPLATVPHLSEGRLQKGETPLPFIALLDVLEHHGHIGHCNPGVPRIRINLSTEGKPVPKRYYGAANPEEAEGH